MAAFGRNGSRSSAERLSNVERHREWIELRRQGLLESEIALRYGVSQQAVSKAILRYLRDLPTLAAEDLRRMELERLDKLWAALIPAIKKGQPRAIEVAVRVSERRSKLLGLDVPTTHHITGDQAGLAQIAIMNVFASSETVSDELIARIQELESNQRAGSLGQVQETRQLECRERGDADDGYDDDM